MSPQQERERMAGQGPVGVDQKKESTTEVLGQTNVALRDIRSVLDELDERMKGPLAIAEDSAKCGPGLMAQAFEARGQAQVILKYLQEFRELM